MGHTKTPLVLGFGHKARQGKDEAAKTILRERGGSHKVAIISFADALRHEVNTEVSKLREQGSTVSEAYQVLCRRWKAEYDPHAAPDETYPHGKQRKLLQAIGQGRREQDPDYWVKRWQQVVHNSDADVVIVADMRYPNEMKVIKGLGGKTIKFMRLGFAGLSPEAAAHISENALNEAIFDYYIVVNDGELERLRSKTLQLFDYLTTTVKDNDTAQANVY